MSNNVVSLPFEDFEEADEAVKVLGRRQKIMDFVVNEVYPFCEAEGIDTTTEEFKHQAAVIVTQLQIIMMKANK